MHVSEDIHDGFHPSHALANDAKPLLLEEGSGKAASRRSRSVAMIIGRLIAVGKSVPCSITGRVCKLHVAGAPVEAG